MGSRAPSHASSPARHGAGERPFLRLAFAGGGTGGHVVPGRHLLDNLRLDEEAPFRLTDLVWFTTGRAIEERAFAGIENDLASSALERVPLPLEPAGGGAPSLPGLGLRTLPAVARARRALKEHRTDVLLGLGGFTSLPAVLAARSLSIPVALLEINATRGKATRWLSRFAQRVFHAWPRTLPPGEARARTDRAGRDVWTGPPLATRFQGGAPAPERVRASRVALGFDPARPLLCVLGGSQGAGGLNRFVARHLERFEGVQLLHQTGPGRAAEGAAASPDYRPVEFVSDVATALTASDLVLCRGGASTLAELCGLCRPAVVVPYPHHPDLHQEENARQLGAGVRVVREEELTPAVATELRRLVSGEALPERERMAAELARRLPTDRPARLLLSLLADLAR